MTRLPFKLKPALCQGLGHGDAAASHGDGVGQQAGLPARSAIRFANADRSLIRSDPDDALGADDACFQH